MFYRYVKQQYRAGNVSIGLSSDRRESKVWLEGKGLAGLAIPLLSKEEKAKLRELSKQDAKETAAGSY